LYACFGVFLAEQVGLDHGEVVGREEEPEALVEHLDDRWAAVAADALDPLRVEKRIEF
jgi:hypothetical protein